MSVYNCKYLLIGGLIFSKRTQYIAAKNNNSCILCFDFLD